MIARKTGIQSQKQQSSKQKIDSFSFQKSQRQSQEKLSDFSFTQNDINLQQEKKAQSPKNLQRESIQEKLKEQQINQLIQSQNVINLEENKQDSKQRSQQFQNGRKSQINQKPINKNENINQTQEQLDKQNQDHLTPQDIIKIVNIEIQKLNSDEISARNPEQIQQNSQIVLYKKNESRPFSANDTFLTQLTSSKDNYQEFKSMPQTTNATRANSRPQTSYGTRQKMNRFNRQNLQQCSQNEFENPQVKHFQKQNYEKESKNKRSLTNNQATKKEQIKLIGKPPKTQRKTHLQEKEDSLSSKKRRSLSSQGKDMKKRVKNQSNSSFTESQLQIVPYEPQEYQNKQKLPILNDKFPRYPSGKGIYEKPKPPSRYLDFRKKYFQKSKKQENKNKPPKFQRKNKLVVAKTQREMLNKDSNKDSKKSKQKIIQISEDANLLKPTRSFSRYKQNKMEQLYNFLYENEKQELLDYKQRSKTPTNRTMTPQGRVTEELKQDIRQKLTEENLTNFSRQSQTPKALPCSVMYKPPSLLSDDQEFKESFDQNQDEICYSARENLQLNFTNHRSRGVEEALKPEVAQILNMF